MKRFNFDHQAVLQLREDREEECRIELGRAVSVLNQIESRIRDTAASRHNAAMERFTNDPGEMQTWDNYILRLDTEIERLMEQAAKAELVVEEKQAAYLEASKELKVIEKLKENQAKKHRKETFAALTAELDDHPRVSFAV
jgi:flagellar FliJ protein